MMRKFPIKMGLLGILLLVACGGATGGTETGNATPDGIASAVGDSIDTVSGLLNSEPDFDSVAGLSFEKPACLAVRRRFSLLPSAIAAPPCVVTATCDETTHTAIFIKDFSLGCDTGDGFTVEGKRYISWFNMGAGACSGPNAKPLFLNAIQGDGARQIRSTDAIPDTGACDMPVTPIAYAFDDGARLEITQCSTLEYANFNSPAPGEGTVRETFELSSSRRVFLRPNGSKLYDHSLLTPSPVVADLVKLPTQNRPNKTIHEGVVRVVHNLAQFSVDTQYQEVVWDYNECRCYPVSGTLTFTVTNLVTGQTQGSGSLTFDKDATGSCRVAQATFGGQTLNIPLHACRGL
ncbi:MAG: hypothetical protein U1F66_03695 [bacterium]